MTLIVLCQFAVSLVTSATSAALGAAATTGVVSLGKSVGKAAALLDDEDEEEEGGGGAGPDKRRINAGGRILKISEILFFL